MKKLDVFLKVFISLTISTFLLSVCFVSCNSYEAEFDFASLQQLCTDNKVELENDGIYIIARPTAGNENDNLPEKTGFIFYPGAFVACESYLPLLIQIAGRGYTCIVIQMTNDFALFHVNAADRVIHRYTDIKHWYICGHSLGGAMAATYASENYDKLDGLVLLAAYSTEDLKNSGLKVLSVYGTNDGVLQHDKYDSLKRNLPIGFIEVPLTGGNHSNFGNYGFQKGDKPCDSGMDRTTQQRIVAKCINCIARGKDIYDAEYGIDDDIPQH